LIEDRIEQYFFSEILFSYGAIRLKYIFNLFEGREII